GVVAAYELGLELVQLVLELGHREIDGGEAVGGRHLAAHVMPVTFHGHLAHLFVGDAPVVFLGEVDLRPVHAFEVPGQAPDLLDGAGPQQFGDFGVPAADGDLHSRPPFHVVGGDPRGYAALAGPVTGSGHGIVIGARVTAAGRRPTGRRR